MNSSLDTYSFDDTTITKTVNEKELVFTLAASDANICPKVLKWYRCKRLYCFVMKRYPITLRDDLEPGKRTEKVLELVEKLHSLGILHNDLSVGDGTTNVVLNPETGDVRLIDFGESIWLDDLKNDQVQPKCKDELKRARGMCEYAQDTLDEDAEKCRDPPYATSFFRLDVQLKNGCKYVVLETLKICREAAKSFEKRTWTFPAEKFTKNELHHLDDWDYCDGCVTMPTNGFNGKNTWCDLSRKIATLQEPEL